MDKELLVALSILLLNVVCYIFIGRKAADSKKYNRTFFFAIGIIGGCIGYFVGDKSIFFFPLLCVLMASAYLANKGR